MTTEISEGRLDAAGAARLSEAVLAVLIPSGVQEHEEESGLVGEIPRPDEMLGDIHHRKTGLLFQAPLRLVEHVGDAGGHRLEETAQALSHFGIACQILDDYMDVAEDLSQHRHNLVLSLAYHGSAIEERAVSKAIGLREQLSEAQVASMVAQLPLAIAKCRALAADHFARTYRELSSAVPSFDRRAVESLGTLVQAAIMKDRFEGPLEGAA